MATQTKQNDIFRFGDLPRDVANRVTGLPKDVAKRSREVWLAGLGALATVEEESTGLFDRRESVR